MVTSSQAATSTARTGKQAVALRNVMWIAMASAVFTAVSYVLINAGILTVGDVPHEEGSATGPSSSSRPAGWRRRSRKCYWKSV